MNDTIDPSVARLETSKECDQFIENVRTQHPALAVQAERRAVQLLAQGHTTASEAEQEAWETIYAFERMQFQKNGKKMRAARTRNLITRLGVIKAVESIVEKPDPMIGYDALKTMGLEHLSFESIVLKYPELFSEATRATATKRLAK